LIFVIAWSVSANVALQGRGCDGDALAVVVEAVETARRAGEELLLDLRRDQLE
jgi:hypothetical protein